ncbi:MAG: cyclic nucleotide-binding domain-containing protein [Pseudomonadota bacterium]
MTGFDLFDLAGAVGVACYIASYLGLQLGWLKGAAVPYTSLNLAAAALVLISLTDRFNLYSAIIQITWIVISLLGFARLYALSREARLDPEEGSFHSAMFPEMERRTAARLIRSGAWREGVPGEVVVAEGQPVAALIYLASGKAEVSLRGRRLTVIDRPAFLGEMGALSGLPATATVTLSGPARLWEHPVDALERRLADPSLRLQVEGALARDVRRKLMLANERLVGVTALR